MPENAVTTTTPTPVRTSTGWRRTARWVASFVGFPIGGLTAWLVVGPVNSSLTAVLGGALTGAILGTAQAAGLGLRGAAFPRYLAATAVGLAAGLGIGATAVGFATDLPSLVLQGAISGLAVGIAQAVELRGRLGRLALGWPPVLAACWALGWFLTTSVGVKVEDQWTVFGAAGAITVTVLTVVLPAALARKSPARETTARMSITSKRSSR